MSQSVCVPSESGQALAHLSSKRGWVKRKLGECLRLINGRAYSQHEMLTEGAPIIRIQNLNGGKRWFYSNLNLPEDQYCDKGDLLFAWSATFGPYIWNGSKAIYHYHIWKVIPNENIDKDFAYYLLAEITSEIKAASHGLAMLHMTKHKMESWEVAVPPLPEQKRIAAILNDQMPAVEKARVAAEAQLEAAESLPAAYLRDVFDSPEVGQWVREKLGNVSQISGGIQKTPDRKPKNFHRPYLTVRNVQRGYLDLSNLERFEVTESELDRLRLRLGDILIVEGNGSLDHIGRNALFKGEVTDCIHQNHIIRVRLDEQKLLPEFVSRFLNSNSGKSQMIQKAMTTSGLYTLSAGKVAALEIPMPSMRRQREIVEILNNELPTAEKACEAIKDQLETINALPAALLRQALTGKL